MSDKKKNKLNWGIGIAVLYGGFVVFILSFVIFSTTQNYTLVEDNYYQKSLSFQNRIDKLRNSAKLSIKPSVKINKDENELTITFQESLANVGITGTAHFFRPSDKRADQVLELTLNENAEMVLSTTRFLKGLWVIKLDWESSGVSYYQEENLTL